MLKLRFTQTESFRFKLSTNEFLYSLVKYQKKKNCLWPIIIYYYILKILRLQNKLEYIIKQYQENTHNILNFQT